MFGEVDFSACFRAARRRLHHLRAKSIMDKRVFEKRSPRNGDVEVPPAKNLVR